MIKINIDKVEYILMYSSNYELRFDILSLFVEVYFKSEYLSIPEK